jgi:PAS domain S-box-containing protein
MVQEKMVKQKQVVGLSHFLALAAGLIATCLGLLVMVGWHSHHLALVQVLPNTPYMRYNTAFAFFLSGLALVALARGRYKIARWLGIVVGAIGFLSLIQYIFDLNLGIDQLLLKDYLSPTAPRSGSLHTINYSSQFFIKINKPFPGRPAPNTAFSFALTGAALFLLSRVRKLRKSSLIAGIFGAIIGAMGVVALLGYLSSVLKVYSWGYSLGVAIHTAFGLLVLSLGIMTLALNTRWHRQGDELRTRRDPLQSRAGTWNLGVQPFGHENSVAGRSLEAQPLPRGENLLEVPLNKGDLEVTPGFKTGSTEVIQQILAIVNPRNWSIEKKTFVALCLAALTLVSTNIFSYWSFVNYKENSLTLSAQSRQITGKLDTILSSLKDAETGQRGYIITGIEDYLEPDNQATKNIYQQLRELQVLTPDNPTLATHSSLVIQKLAELSETIELRKNTGFAAAQQVVKTDRGKIIMDRIRRLTEEMKQEENELLKQRLEQSRGNIGTQNFLSIGIVLTFCLFYWIFYVLKQENSRQQQTEQELRQSEQRWKVLYKTLPIGVVLIDPNDASFVNFNDAAAINLGYTSEEFAGLKIADIDLSLNREEILHIVQTLAQQNEGIEFETQHHTKSGEIRDVLVRGQQLVLNNRTLVYGVWLDITERLAAVKEREQALLDLQHSEQRYRSLLTATTQIIWTTNAKGEVIENMPGWGLITGQSAEEMKGWGWLSVIHPDDQELTSRLWNQALQTKSLYEIEHRLRMVDGSYRDFSVSAAPVLDDYGEIVEWVGTDIDITEKKQAQQALKMTQFCVDTATDAISWIGNDLRFAYVNDAMCRELGYSRSELMAMSVSDIDPNISLEGMMQLGQAMKEQGSIKFETQHLRQDGSIFPVEVVANHLQFGELEYACCFTRDMSDRKLAESQLQKSHNLLQTVIEGTADAIFAKDLQGRFMLVNSMTATIIGKPVEEILNKDDRDLFPAEIASVLRETDRHIMTTGVNQVIEEEVLTNGKLRTYLSAKSVWRDAQGKIIGLVGIARDITERKLAEQEIKKLNEDLERRVIERTAELTAANSELEAFSYSVSHDLRAPLRGIDGFSQALLERYSDQLEDKAKHYLTRIRAGTQRMGELIDDLLTLSRVTRTEMRRQQVDLSAIATEISTELQQLEPERQVEFAISPRLVAHGDVQLLRVVLENLLNNAWKFTSASIQTKIEFSAILQADAKIAYFIRDNGAGFDMAYSNKLFGAFQRLHSTSQFPGTGIGLATVQRIINRHGGKVWAEGKVEQGATFYFTL